MIETADPAHQFEEILAVGRGFGLLPTEKTRSFLCAIACELCNFELYFAINCDFPRHDLVSRFWEELSDFEIVDYIPAAWINYRASHFIEIDSSVLSHLPISILSRVLSNESLQVKSEDALYDLVHSRFEADSRALELLSLIRFDFLTCESINKFISSSFNHFGEIDFSIGLWRALCNRLSLDVENHSVAIAKYRNTRFRSLSIPPGSAVSLDGIIAYLTRELGGNVSDLHIVEITGPAQSASQLAKYAATFDTAHYFHSENKPDRWICYDFKNRRVLPTHYSIHAHTNNWWLRSWVLEGSSIGPADGPRDVWTELDRRENDASTKADHPIGTFPVSASGAYRFLRLRQTGKNAGGQDWLILFAFEIFGDLIG
jgi:hypothetical protein